MMKSSVGGSLTLNWLLRGSRILGGSSKIGGNFKAFGAWRKFKYKNINMTGIQPYFQQRANDAIFDFIIILAPGAAGRRLGAESLSLVALLPSGSWELNIHLLLLPLIPGRIVNMITFMS